MALRLLVFFGSVRTARHRILPGRLGLRVARAYRDRLAAEGHEVELINPLDLDLGDMFEPHFAYRTRTMRVFLACFPVLPRPSHGAEAEALWKQEGAKYCRFLRNPAHGTRTAVGFKWRKCRKNTQTSAIVHGSLDTTHNLKVVGSNPTPATNIFKFVDFALLRLYVVCVNNFVRYVDSKNQQR